MQGSFALWMRLGEVMVVGRGSIAADLTQDLRAAHEGGVQTFQGENGGAFSEREAVAANIKRTGDGGGNIKGTATGGREGPERVKPGEHELAKRIIAASKNAFGLAVLNEREG